MENSYKKIRQIEMIDSSKAITEYQLLIKKNPVFWKGYFRLALLLSRVGKIELPNELLSTVVTLNLAEEETIIPNWRPITFLQNGIESPDENNESFPLKHAEISELINFLKVSKSPKIIIAYLHLQRAFSMGGISENHYGDCYSDCEEAINLSENQFWGYFGRSRINYGWAFEDEALSDIKTCINLNPNFSLSHFELGCINRNDYANAIKAFSKCLELNPNYYLAYINRSKLLDIKLNQLELSIAGVNSALKIHIDPDFYQYRGRLNIKLNKFEDAVIDFNKCLELTPDNFSVYNKRAEAKYLQHKFDEAISDFTVAISLTSSKFVSAYINRGHCKVHLKDYEGALKDYRKFESEDFYSKKSMQNLLKYLKNSSEEDVPNLLLRH